MGKKAQLKKFRKLANSMPVVLEHTCEKHVVKGAELASDLNLLNRPAEVEGKPIDPEKEYIKAMPVQIAMNHARRMKKAFQRAGEAGVDRYIAGVQLHAIKRITQ